MKFWKLVSALAGKDLKRRYQGNWLRLLLSPALPFLNVLIFTQVFSRIVGVGSEGRPYAAFVYVAIVPWRFFSACVTGGSLCLVTNVPIITRLHFQRMAIPFSVLFTNLIPFTISAIPLALVLWWQGIPAPSWAHIYLLPILAAQLTLSAGIVLLLSISTAYFRKSSSLCLFFFRACFFASPVIYSIELVPDRWHAWYALNPMAGILAAYRRVLLHREAPDPVFFGPAVLISAAIFVIGFLVFKRFERHIADVV